MVDGEHDQPESEQEQFLTAEQILNAPERPVVVHLPDLGALALRPASEFDLNWLSDVVEKIAEPRELVLTILHHQWVESEVESDQLAALPDEHLLHAMREWLNATIALQEDELAELSGIHQGVRAAIERWNAPVRELANSSISRVLDKLRADEAALRREYERMDVFTRMRLISDIYPHYQAVKRLAEINRGIDPSRSFAKDVAGNLEHVRAATTHYRVLLDLMPDQEQVKSASYWGVLPSLQLTEAITRAYASAASSGARRAAEFFVSLAPLQETAAHALTLRSVIEASVDHTRLSVPERSALSGLSELTGSANSFWNDLADHPDLFAGTSEQQREASVEQVFRATRTVGLLMAPEPEIVEARPAVGLLAAEAADIIPALERVDPALVPIYSGALERFRGKGADYIRHTTASMRALFENMFPILAPENEIQAWNASVLPEKGPVSYKARLAFIFRHVAQRAGYDRMTENDILHVEQSLILLDAQVHRMEASIAEEALRELLIRWEFSLQHVLRTHRDTEAAAAGR